MRGRSGFTLIELLIASAIMGIILTALSGLFVSSIRANQATTRVAEGQQNAEAAIHLLKNEISLAGYRGTDSGAGTRQFSPAGTPTLAVTVESTTRDRVSVRFFDDRPDGAVTNTTNPPQRLITFGINANNELTRQVDGGNNFAVVEGVTGLKVIRYMLDGGSTTTTMPANRADIRGVILQMTFVVPSATGTTTTTRNTTIALSNIQQ